MKPAKLNLTIYQGTTFSKSFQWKTGEPLVPVDLTGCTLRMDIRKKLKDPEAVVTLTDANNKIVLTDAVNGRFEIRLTSTETATFDFASAVYDFEISYAGGEPTYRIFEGSVTVVPEVTRT